MIVVVDRIPDVPRHQQWLKEQLGQAVPFYERIADADLTDVEILIGPSGGFTVADLERAPNLRWYHALSAGVDALPLQAMAARGVQVSNSSGIHRIPMAEQAFGMMLMFTRNLHHNVRNGLDAKWAREYKCLSELADTTLCIVGAGRIADAVAARAKAFEMTVIGVKRTVEADGHASHASHAAERYPNYDAMVPLADMDSALAKADWVLLLLPLTSESKGLFDAKKLSLLKPSAVLLNLARGGVVDEDALIAALASGQLAGAGLDVFAQEPLPEDSPLWRMDNVIVTPHTGGSSQLYYDRALQLFMENYDSYRRGDRLPNAVDVSRGY